MGVLAQLAFERDVGTAATAAKTTEARASVEAELGRSCLCPAVLRQPRAMAETQDGGHCPAETQWHVAGLKDNAEQMASPTTPRANGLPVSAPVRSDRVDLEAVFAERRPRGLLVMER